MRFFEALADRVDAAWRKVDCDQAQFPDVAMHALEETPPSAHIEPGAILDYVLQATSWPRQADVRGQFGDPPVQVAMRENFQVEALFWTDGTTSIHDHAFSGAFHVLAGSSLHSRYHFECGRHINNEMELGKLQRHDSELLSKGATRPILMGRRMIHSLFHLDYPSVTVVVRTHYEHFAQHNYDLPGVSTRNLAETEMGILRSRVLRLLKRINPAHFERASANFFQSAELSEAYRFIVFLATGLGTPAMLEAALSVLQKRDAEVALAFEEALYEMTRRTQLIALRAQARDPETRFVLSLLLNLQSRDVILAMLKDRFADAKPAERLCRALATIKQPLGVAFDEPVRTALQAHLEGRGDNALLDPLREQNVLDPLFV